VGRKGDFPATGYKRTGGKKNQTSLFERNHLKNRWAEKEFNVTFRDPKGDH